MMFKLSDFIMMETQFPRGVQVVLDFDVYHLSIACNDMSAGYEDGLYETALFNSKDGLARDVIEVKGHLTEAAVDVIINDIHQLTKISPIQV
jgi:hypothetical protein